MWPTNAVSTRDVIGSAAKANAAGNAIDMISIPILPILTPTKHDINFKKKLGSRNKSIGAYPCSGLGSGSGSGDSTMFCTF